MISLRKSVNELEKLDDFKRTALDAYALTIGALAEHALEVDAGQAAQFRAQIQALRKQLKPDTTAAQLLEVQSSCSAELREYSEKAQQILQRLRSDIRAASRAMDSFAGSFAASSMDLDGELKRDLQLLDQAARLDDLTDVRGVINGVSASIASSVERMRTSNQLAIAQLKDEIRLLHQELKTGRPAAAQARSSAAAAQKETLGHIDSLVQKSTPFSLMLVAVKNLRGLQSCYSQAALDHAISSLHARLQTVLPSGSRSSRWADGQFLVILTVDPAAALSISRNLSMKLSGTYAGPDESSKSVTLETTSGVIDWKAPGDPGLLRRRLDQLSDTLSQA